MCLLHILLLRLSKQTQKTLLLPLLHLPALDWVHICSRGAAGNSNVTQGELTSLPSPRASPQSKRSCWQQQCCCCLVAADIPGACLPPFGLPSTIEEPTAATLIPQPNCSPTRALDRPPTFFVRVAMADFLDLLRPRRTRASSARFSGCGVRFLFCSAAPSAATTWTAPRLGMVGASSCTRWGTTATRLPPNMPARGRLVLNAAACIFGWEQQHCCCVCSGDCRNWRMRWAGPVWWRQL